MLRKVEVQRTDYLYRKVAKGRPYLYFRFPREFGVKPVSLPVDETSKAFERQYDLCLAKLRKLGGAQPEPQPRVTLARFLPGTIGKAIEVYRASSSFAKLKVSTQQMYIGRLDIMKAKIGDDPLRELDRDAAERFAALMYRESGSAQMSDLYVTLIGNIWKAAREDDQDNVTFGIRKLANPTLEIEQRHKDSDCQPHLRWPEELIEGFDETAPDYLVLARQVLHFTAQRGGDAVRMQWAHYDGKGVNVWPEKTTKKGQVLEPSYHLLPKVLIRALNKVMEDAASDYILVNSLGTKWATRRSLSQAIKAHLVKIGVRQPKQRKGYTAHGLRHTGASEVAGLPGVNSKGVQTITGHKSLRQPERYMEQADKARINGAIIDAWDAELERKEALRAIRRRTKQKAAIRLVKR